MAGVYHSRSYTVEVIEPKRHEVTAKAYLHIAGFIKECEELKMAEDWRLTKRENQVMELFSKGLSNKETADKLGIELSTLKTFTADVYSRYGVNDKLNAVLTYIRNTREIEEVGE